MNAARARPANNGGPFAQAAASADNALREAIARARWIALDLDAPRFCVLTTNSSHDRGRLGLCFDNEHPQISAASRALIGPAAMPLIAHSSRSTAPCAWPQTADDHLSPMLKRIEAPVLGTHGIAFPVAASSGQPGLVVFIGHRVALDEQLLFDIHHRCFHLFEAAASLAASAPAAASVASRERDCLDLSSHGLTSDEIAAQLGLSPHTVNQYLTNTARKLGAVNRVHVVAKALRLGLIN